MSDLVLLQQRIEKAFQRIEDAAISVVKTDASSTDSMRKLAETNVALAAEIDGLNARRKNEADQLDKLIRRLKPLAGVVADA